MILMSEVAFAQSSMPDQRGRSEQKDQSTRVAPVPSPMPRQEKVDPCAGFVWLPGRWDWRNGKWCWVDGYWERERAGKLWVPGRWESRGDVWVWIEGRWVDAAVH